MKLNALTVILAPCAHRRNVRYQVADATEMVLPAGSVDVLFSNWLLMYLSDAEVAKLASDALAWVWRTALSCCHVRNMLLLEAERSLPAYIY